MNGKFVRLFEADLLKTLLDAIDPSLSVNDYVLGIPKNNLNPITRMLGNTYIELHSRNPVPNKSSIVTYYNRANLQCKVKKVEPRRRIDVKDNVYLLDIVDEINKTYLLSMTANDIFNTTIKEFPDGQFYVVILAKPESLRYTGRVEIQVNIDPKELEPTSLEPLPTVVSTLPPAAIELTATVEDRSIVSLVLTPTLVDRV